MAKLFSRQPKHSVNSEMSSPPQTVTIEQLQSKEAEELPPPAVAGTPPRKSASLGGANSPSRSSASGSTAAESDIPDDFGLSCTGLLGEEVLLDTDFGRMARSAIASMSDSLRELSAKMAEPINKETKDIPQGEVIISDLGVILKENEKLKKENTWLQEENASLRGGYEEEDDIQRQRTGKSV